MAINLETQLTLAQLEEVKNFAKKYEIIKFRTKAGRDEFDTLASKPKGQIVGHFFCCYKPSYENDPNRKTHYKEYAFYGFIVSVVLGLMEYNQNHFVEILTDNNHF